MPHTPPHLRPTPDNLPRARQDLPDTSDHLCLLSGEGHNRCTGVICHARRRHEEAQIDDEGLGVGLDVSRESTPCG